MDSDAIQKNSPGQMLRARREAMQIPIDNIASRLGLSTAVIDAIEQDAYERLPAAVYIKGYLRAYANIVALDGQHIIQLFNNTSAAVPEIPPKIRRRDQLISSQKMKTSHYLIILGLLILMLLWYRAHYNDGQEGVDSAPTTIISKPAFDYEFHIVEHPPNNMQSIDLSANTVVDTVALASIDTTTPSTHQDQIKLILSANSWIEITDAHQQRLFFGLGRAGAKIALSGVAPFNVLLGNVSAVQLFYNNKPVALTSDPTSNIAQIIIGE